MALYLIPPTENNLNNHGVSCVSVINKATDSLCVYRFVYIWDTTSRRILYKLPGHAGSVNEVAFHPEESIGEWRNLRQSKITRCNTC